MERITHFFILLFFIIAVPASAQEITVRTLVEKNEVFLGEPFIMQVSVDGEESPGEPSTDSIKDFSVSSVGGQVNSSSRVTIVNGRMSQDVKRGYVFQYNLTAKRAGTLQIPPLELTAAGKTLTTQPVTIKVVAPGKSEKFELVASLSESEVYVGQPLTLTHIWYIGQDVQDFTFNVPVFEDSRFDTVDVRPANSGSLVEIPVLNERLVGTKGQRRYKGKDFLSVEFRKVLIPKQTGSFALPQATVSLSAITGGQRGRYNDPMFDSFFNRGRRSLTKRFVVPSNQPTLTVKALPTNGRPNNFTGLVGKYSITAKAAPVEVSIGDPITLTVEVRGADYLKNVPAPRLSSIPAFASGFKIPKEAAPGKVSSGVVRFKQTLRAKKEDVVEIPPVPLSFFNANTGRYVTEYSAPIALNVRPTKVVTAGDAEGKTGDSVVQTAIEVEDVGIAHNYEDVSVLETMPRAKSLFSNSRNGWILGVPPLLFLLLLFFRFVQSRKGSDPKRAKARQAFSEFRREIVQVSTGGSDKGGVLSCFVTFLQAKLGLGSGAVTYPEFCRSLEQHAVSEDVLHELKAVFDEGDAARYGGSEITSEEVSAFTQRIEQLAKDIEAKVQV